MARIQPRWVVLLVALGATLPFLFQAYHMDDRIYLSIADHILKQPLFPYSFHVVFEGTQAPDVASHSHLPLTSYFLVVVKLLAGGHREWADHLFFAVFPLLAAAGMYDLSSRYVRFPLAATCLLLFSPAFMVHAHTLMNDVPLLALWLLALSRFLRVMDGSKSRVDRLICFVSVLLASFISLFTLALLILMGVFSLLRRRGPERPERPAVSSWLLMLLLAPVLLWGLWYLRGFFHYDRFVLVNTALHMGKRHIFQWDIMLEKLLSYLLTCGGVFFFPLACWYGFGRRLSSRIALLILLLSYLPFYAGMAGWLFRPDLQRFHWSFFHVTLFACFFSTGILANGYLLRLGYRAGRDLVKGAAGPAGVATRTAEDMVLFLWGAGIFLACMLLYYSGAVRYVLPALPVFVILWVRSLEERISDHYFLRNCIWLGVVLSALYGFSVSMADYQFAGMYRSAARRVVEDYERPGRTIWFTAEWGLRYYLEQNGARVLPRIAVGPRPGDVIVKPFVAMPWTTLYDPRRYSHFLERRVLDYRNPIRMLGFRAHAGFYSTGWGILPLSWENGRPWEWISVLQVDRAYQGPLPRQDREW